MKIQIIIILLVYVFLLLSCHDRKSEKPEMVHKNEKISINQIDHFTTLKKLSINEDYNFKKQQIKEEMTNAKDHNISQDSASNLFEKYLLYGLIPYWIGTAWSFEGHTTIPGKGEIACGYFISTTLSDAGLKVDRIKMAQQNPYNEAKTLSGPSPVINVSRSTYMQCIETIRDTLPQGIHFIGFDSNHVGYVFKDNDALYLIHSNYKNSEGVVIETIENSEVFKYFSIFHLAKISGNKWLMEQWMENTNIVTHLK